MSFSEEVDFTFTWQLLNLRMCALNFEEFIQSPVFVADKLKESEWRLKLYPYGCDKEGTVSCFLVCYDVGYYTDGVNIGFSITLSSSVSKKSRTLVHENKVFKLDDIEGWPEFVKREDIFNDAYVPNDILTVKLSLWRVDNSNCGKTLSDKEISLASQHYLEDFEIGDGCSVLTRIPVQVKTLSWPIWNFSSIGSNKRITKFVNLVLRDEPSFKLTLYKSTDGEKVEIEIQRLEDKWLKQTFVKCKISVVHFPTSDFFAEEEHLFDTRSDNDTNNGLWKFPSFLKISKLQEKKYFHHTCGSLHLDIEFALSQLEDEYSVEKVSSINKFQLFTNVYNAVDEFGHLYKSGELSDMKLRAGDKEFKVHKIILKARSPVFSSMFDRDMNEKETGVVDVNPDILDRMLGYMYTNVLGDIQVEDAIKLYSAADKYQVLPLKLRCTWILKSMISVKSVCAVLNVAYSHSDEHLYVYAERFVRCNSLEIFRSQYWEDFMRSNLIVAAKVMHKLLLN